MSDPIKFPRVEIDVTQVARVKPVPFIIDLVIDNQILRLQMHAMNQESMMAQLSILGAANLPRVQGWNLYGLEGKLLASVSVVDFLGDIAAKTPLEKSPGDAKSAGFRVVPAVTQMSQAFKDSISQARAEGRVPE